MEKRPDPKRGRIWLIALGILGAIIVVLSIPVYSISSGMSIIGYVIGFICLLLAAVALYDARRK